MNTQNQIVNLPSIMSLSQWRSVEEKARQDTVKAIRAPLERDYMAAQVSTYPRQLTLGVIGMLAVVIGGAFVISAGKQLVSYDSVLGQLASETRLSALWVSASLIAGVGLSEIGTLLFSFAAAIFGKGRHQWAFRATAALCALMAVLANVAVTASHQYDGPIAAGLAWFMTLFAPGVVIVGALVGERLILDYLEKRRDATVKYEVARREYEIQRMNPERHQEYQRCLYLRTVEQYRKKFGAVIDSQEVSQAVFMRDVTTFCSMPNFTQLPETAGPSNN